VVRAGLLDSLRSRGALACVATCCAVQFLGLLDTSTVSLALPSIARELHLSTASLQWVLSVYGISFAGFVLVGGSVADLFGRRRTVLTGLAVVGAGSLAGAAAPGLPVLLAARAAQGLGAAIMLPAALALLVVRFTEGPARRHAFGAWAASGGAALVCGGVLGGFLSGRLGWRATFGCMTVLAAGAALLAAALPDDRFAPGARRRIDLAGAVLTGLCLTLLVYAAGQAQTSSWTAPGTVLPFAGAALSALAFVVVEARSPAPMLRLGILRTPGVAGANLLCLVFPAGFLGALVLGSLLLQSGYGFSGAVAGLAILPFSGTVLAGTSLAPALIGRLGAVRVAVAGFGLLVAGLLGLAAATTGSYAGALPALVLLGAGSATASVPLALGAVAGVSAAESGMATGLLSTSQQAGGALMIAVLTGVTAAWTPGHGARAAAGHALAPGLRAGFLAAAALCAAAAVLTPWLLRTGAARTPPGAELPAPTAA
jgi:MFS family permease